MGMRLLSAGHETSLHARLCILFGLQMGCRGIGVRVRRLFVSHMLFGSFSIPYVPPFMAYMPVAKVARNMVQRRSEAV